MCGAIQIFSHLPNQNGSPSMRWSSRRLVPEIDGASSMQEWKDAPWTKFSMGARLPICPAGYDSACLSSPERSSTFGDRRIAITVTRNQPLTGRLRPAEPERFNLNRHHQMLGPNTWEPQIVDSQAFKRRRATAVRWQSVVGQSRRPLTKFYHMDSSSHGIGSTGRLALHY